MKPGENHEINVKKLAVRLIGICVLLGLVIHVLYSRSPNAYFYSIPHKLI